MSNDDPKAKLRRATKAMATLQEATKAFEEHKSGRTPWATVRAANAFSSLGRSDLDSSPSATVPSVVEDPLAKLREATRAFEEHKRARAATAFSSLASQQSSAQSPRPRPKEWLDTVEPEFCSFERKSATEDPIGKLREATRAFEEHKRARSTWAPHVRAVTAFASAGRSDLDSSARAMVDSGGRAGDESAPTRVSLAPVLRHGAVENPMARLREATRVFEEQQREQKYRR